VDFAEGKIHKIMARGFDSPGTNRQCRVPVDFGVAIIINAGQAGATGPPPAESRCEVPCTHRRAIMATYIALSSFTDQGIKNAKDSIKRADAVKAAAKKFGAKMTQIYWTLGSYDVVAIIEAADDESATAFALSIGMAGNVRTQTLRAFSAEEMKGILGKMA
jgi:uncharacterized protein with GYD domain